MATSYHNDQFYNLNKLTGGLDTADNPYVTSPPNNPRFKMWDTNSTVRVTDANGNPTNLQMQRGYIRSLITTAYGTTVPIRKCQFQFNPQVIQQSVQSNSEMLNVIQQPLEQLAQPIAASQQFGFQLMFDRQMEVNNAPNTAPNYTDPWDQGDPGQVGVLRDLSVLYSIIGQGFSDTQAEYIKQSLTDQARIKAATDAANSASATGTTASASTTQVTADSANNLSNFVNVNIGNSAFLLPLPVRIVFSSLFMVEGLVTQTDVTFTKFSTTMVPMQCLVNITMDAKYIGFAKKDTLFTQANAQQAQAVKDAAVAQSKNQVQANIALGSIFSTLGLRLANMDHSSVSFSDVLHSSKAGYQVNLIQNVPQANFGDIIDKMWSDGLISSITESPHVQVWGPYYGINTLTSSAAGLKQAIANSRSKSTPTEWALFDTQFILPQSTVDEYRTYVAGTSSGNKPSRWGFDGSAAGQVGASTNSSSGGPHTYSTSSVQYIVAITGQITMVMSDGTTMTAVLDNYFLQTASDLMVWNVQTTLSPNNVPQSAVSALAPPASNKATKTPAPGSVSKVGTQSGSAKIFRS